LRIGFIPKRGEETRYNPGDLIRHIA